MAEEKKTHPLLWVALIGAGVAAYSYFKTAKAALNLDYRVTKFQIYNLVKDGNLVLRLQILFTNREASQIVVNNIDLSAYLNSIYSRSEDGSITVNNNGDFFARLKDDRGFVIAANSDTYQDFYINVSWKDLGKILAFNIVDIVRFIVNNNVREMVNELLSKPVLIKGDVKAENIKFPITQVVSVTN